MALNGLVCAADAAEMSPRVVSHVDALLMLKLVRHFHFRESVVFGSAV